MDIYNLQLTTCHYTLAPDNSWLHSCELTRRSAPTVPTCQHGGEQPAFGKWAFRAGKCATCQGVWQVGLASGIGHAWASGNATCVTYTCSDALPASQLTHRLPSTRRVDWEGGAFWGAEWTGRVDWGVDWSGAAPSRVG